MTHYDRYIKAIREFKGLKATEAPGEYYRVEREVIETWDLLTEAERAKATIER